VSDLLKAAKAIMQAHDDPNIRDPSSKPLVVSLARYYVATHPDEPDAPCDLDWLEARGWKIIPKQMTLGDNMHGAQLRGGSIGPFNRFIQIDDVGCSITAMQSPDAVRWAETGFPLDQMPKMFTMPICKGWATRRVAVILEQFAKIMGGDRVDDEGQDWDSFDEDDDEYLNGIGDK
jgi:hypothetical protein